MLSLGATIRARPCSWGSGLGSSRGYRGSHCSVTLYVGKYHTSWDVGKYHTSWDVYDADADAGQRQFECHSRLYELTVSTSKGQSGLCG